MIVNKIPLSAAKAIADKYDQRQVVIVAWDGTQEYVVTYGCTTKDCEQAAQGGNRVKAALNWPDEFCNTKPTTRKAK